MPAIVQNLDQLVDLGLALACRTSMEGMCHTVPQVIAQRLLLHLVERRPHRPDLCQHVDAVAVFLDHAGDATNLTFNATKPRKLRLLDFIIHSLNDTPAGYR